MSKKLDLLALIGITFLVILVATIDWWYYLPMLMSPSKWEMFAMLLASCALAGVIGPFTLIFILGAVSFLEYASSFVERRKNARRTTSISPSRYRFIVFK